MAERTSIADSPSAVPPPNSTTPSNQQRRQNRRDRPHQQPFRQLDGSVSDTPLSGNIASPQSQRGHRHKQSSPMGGYAQQQSGSVGQTGASHPQPTPLRRDSTAATPAKEQAYAGPTFQSSPAASSLPLPKFISRSKSIGGAPSFLQGDLAAGAMSEGSESSPEPDIVKPGLSAMNAQKSPLDVFFAADRAEKGRRASSNPSHESAWRPPQWAPGSGEASKRSPKQTFPPHVEVEPAHDVGAQSVAQEYRQPLGTDEDRQAITKSLKDLLFNASESPISTPPHQSGANSGAHTPDSVYNTPPPFFGGRSGSSTPAGSNEQPNHYALHYGNRNLSPLFKASRAETPPRPSSLRQEVPGSLASPVNSRPEGPPPWPGPPPSNSTMNGSVRHPSDPRLYHPPNPQSSSDNSRNAATASPFSGPVSPPVPQSFAGLKQASSSPDPQSDAPKDIRAMEDDLRRMLKLNG